MVLSIFNQTQKYLPNLQLHREIWITAEGHKTKPDMNMRKIFVGSLGDKKRHGGDGQSSQYALHNIFNNVKMIHNNNNSESSNLDVL